jgi:hypothetical protein
MSVSAFWIAFCWALVVGAVVGLLVTWRENPCGLADRDWDGMENP